MPNPKNIPAFSQFLYRYRNLVERFFSKIKHFRAVATLRKARRQLPRARETRRSPNLDAVSESVT
jgi:transposase